MLEILDVLIRPYNLVLVNRLLNVPSCWKVEMMIMMNVDGVVIVEAGAGAGADAD